MESLFCLFCARANPADANFCNECGTPLHLKPCRQCDAVNPRTAERCYRCEGALPVEAGTLAREVVARAQIAPSTEDAPGDTAPAHAASGSMATPTRAASAVAAPVPGSSSQRMQSGNGIEPAADVAGADETGTGVQPLDTVARAFGGEGARRAAVATSARDAAPEAAVVTERPAASRAAAPLATPIDPGMAIEHATVGNVHDADIIATPDQRGPTPGDMPSVRLERLPSRDDGPSRDADSDPVRWHLDDARLPEDEDAPVIEADAPPRRGMRYAAAGLLFVIALAVPAAMYVTGQPRLLERIGLGGVLDGVTRSTTTNAPSSTAAPTTPADTVSPPNAVTTPIPPAAVPQPGPPDAAPGASPATSIEPRADPSTSPASAAGASDDSPVPSGSPTPIEAVPAAPSSSAATASPRARSRAPSRQDAGAAAARPSTSGRDSRSRDERERPRADAQEQRQGTARSERDPSPCTPQVAALGLCSP